jgi:hypothetical protein
MMEDVGTSANQIIQLDSNAKIPAVDGSLLTNMSSALSGSSDPLITTNPSGGVGTKYKNTTDGEMFICTDATAGENVWTNIGAGSGNIVPASHAAGNSYGYMSGGSPSKNYITKYSFTVDGNDVDVGDLTVTRYSNPAGSSDTTHGYTAGGDHITIVIDRFSFSAGGNAVDVGDMLTNTYNTGSSQSLTYSYTHGGYGAGDMIQKFLFAATANSTDVGNLITSMSTAQGCSSATHGYYAGGQYNKDIQKYSHSTDGNATDVGEIVGDTSNASRRATGSSSYTHGYYAAGSYFSNQIHKFSFANESTQTDVGNLLNSVTATSSTSSYTHGYVQGGYGNTTGAAPHSYLDTIQKYSFTTDGDATDVGNLGSPRSGGAFAEGCGQQY